MKTIKLLTSLLLAFSVSAETVVNFLRPSSPADTYPVNITRYQKGGKHTWMTNVSQLTDTSAATGLPAARREAGMTSQVDGSIYLLGDDLSTWTLITPFLVIPEFETSISEVVSPMAYQIFQRTNASAGPMTVTAYVAGPTGTALEARYNGGSWETIGSSDQDGLVEGVLGDQPVLAAGGNFELRLVGLSDITTISNVGVGDVFAIWGQSNGSGRLTTNQVYGGSALASMLGNDYIWHAMADQTDSRVGQIDSVSSDNDSQMGSVWPIVATYMTATNNVPFAVVQCTRGGTGFGASQPSWVPGADHFDRSTLFGSAMYRTRLTSAKAVIWWQGEGWGVSSNLYYLNVTNVVNQAVASLPTFKFIPISIQEIVGATTGQTNVWTAIDWLWNSGNSAILHGPTLATYPLGGADNIYTEDEGQPTPYYHIKTPTNGAAAAYRIATNLHALFP